MEKHLLHANLIMLFPPTLENMENLVNNTYREKELCMILILYLHQYIGTPF